MGSDYYTSEPPEERALLIGVTKKGETEWQTRDSISELEELASTAGAIVVDTLLFKQYEPHPGHFLGSGKVERIGDYAQAEGVTLVAFDDDLSPAQARNLEEQLKVRVIDRTQMILDIFAQHARTREGSLQIDLAQHEYLLPRLRHMWTHLERQKGGIGLRGPGEKQLEMDRRSIQAHISRLKSELDDVRRHRSELRKGRKKQGWCSVSLVGYTNAGKSTLLNQLTRADVKAYDQLFATLDPTTRKLELPRGRDVLITDTVGFIRKLPHHLVESFKATLEEVQHADLLVHVVDASHPNLDQQMEAVKEVLGELGVVNQPMLLAFNKMDRAEGKSRAGARARAVEDAVAVSAKTGEGTEALLQAIDRMLPGHWVRRRLSIPVTEGDTLAWLRRHGHVLHEEYDEQGAMQVDVTLTEIEAGRLDARLEDANAS